MKSIAIVLTLTTSLLCNITCAGTWTITQISDDRTVYNVLPAISGTNVVWTAQDNTDSELDLEIFSNFAGKITDNSTADYGPCISGTNVAWVNGWRENSEIYTNFAGQISDCSRIYEDWPSISGTNVVWGGRDSGGDYEIFCNFGTGRITTNSINDYTPSISGTNVAWVGVVSGRIEIFSNFDPWQITNNSYNDESPSISGTNVVWHGWDGHDYEIYSNFAGQITDNDFDDRSPRISGTNVVWYGWDGEDWELYTNFGGQLTDNGADETSGHSIFGTTVVWSGWTGSDWEIYMATYEDSPEDLFGQARATLDYFYTFVDDGSLFPARVGKSGMGQLGAMENMIMTAIDYIGSEQLEEAYLQLEAVLAKCDGQSRPPDFVEGPAAADLATMILSLMEGCVP